MEDIPIPVFKNIAGKSIVLVLATGEEVSIEPLATVEGEKFLPFSGALSWLKLVGFRVADEQGGSYVRPPANGTCRFKNISDRPQVIFPPSRWRSFDNNPTVGPGAVFETHDETDAQYMRQLCRPRRRAMDPRVRSNKQEEPPPFAEVTQ